MLTPLNELPQEISEDNLLAWQFVPTTYLDQTKIGLHTGRLARAARIAGFGGVIVRDYQGDQSTFTVESHTITDTNFDGSVAGTVAGLIAEAETERTSIADWQSEDLEDLYKWPHAVVELNRAELGLRVSSRVLAGADQEKAWALEIDRSLRRGIGHAALKKLQKDVSRPGEPWWTSGFITMTGGAGLWESAGSLQAAGITILAGSVIASTGYDHLLRNKFRASGGEPKQLKRRWSAFPFSVHPDRCAGAAGYVLFRRLVDYID